MTRGPDPVWQRWEEVDRLFEAALERPPEERERFLTAACAGDAELLDVVRSLLERAEGPGPHLAGPGHLLLRSVWPGASAALAATEPSAIAAGEQVGRYRITGELGRGGMATVYAAERADGAFEQQVALKVLRRGLDTDDVVRRFVAERQILASLDHPGIAKLLDGGATDDGRPFLVMERVAGQPVTEWADAHRLSVRQRLELVLQVADAVQYAHRRLVVHRDLKPSNILVDDEGRVKLLDFGIAKLLDPRAAGEDAALTRTGVRPQTPEYASPEQVLGQPVTTASDVYQLGLLLYVLMTGRRPFTGRGADLETAITNGRVTRPSETTGPGSAGTPAAASGPGPGAANADVAGRKPQTASSPEAVAHARGTTPDGLRRALRGDVDTIILKALRTEPEARYGSVEALAKDVRRHLDGLPVTARPDTLGYRTAKLLRRHRWLGPAVAAGVLFLLLYIATSIRYAARVAGERDRAEQAAALAEREAATAREVTNFLTGLFRSGNPFVVQDTISVIGLLERGADRVDAELVQQPLVRAELLLALGTAYRGLGRYDRADSLMRGSLGLLRTEGVAENDDRILRTLVAIGENYHASRGFADADTIYHHVFALRRAQAGTRDTDLADLLTLMAMARRDMGDADSALTLVSHGIELRHAAGDTTGPGYLEALGSLAYSLRGAGAPDSAEVVYREVLRRETEAYGPDDIRVGITHNNLGFLLRTREDYVAAETHYREALRIHRAVLGPDHPRTTVTGGNLAVVLERLGKLDEVEALAREQIAAVEALWPDGHWRVGSQYASLGRFFLRNGRFAAAIAPLQTAARIYSRTIGADHEWTVVARAAHGVALLLSGREAEAEAVLRSVQEPLDGRAGIFVPDTQVILDELANALEANGYRERAERYRWLIGSK